MQVALLASLSEDPHATCVLRALACTEIGGDSVGVLLQRSSLLR